MLPAMSAYQALTDRQPKWIAVLVLPSLSSPLRRVYAAVARVLRENGKSVKLYSSEMTFCKSCYLCSVVVFDQ